MGTHMNTRNMQRMEERERVGSEREMGSSIADPGSWEEIERSESYLVCSMFEEAASSAASILKRICDDKSAEAGEDNQLHDMMEAAGMVLVQSLKELGRTPQILNEIKQLFGSVTAIPVQVLLAGACIQISEGSSFGIQEFLEEFLGKWRCVNEQYYVLVGAEANLTYMEGCDGRFVLGLDKYLEVVEVYVVTFLGMVLNNMDLAMSWVEKAALPEEKRQELLRRLHSMYSLKATKSSHGSFSPFPADEHKNCSSLKELNITEESLEALKAQYPPDGDKVTKQAIMKLSGRMDSCFWWFRTFSLKFGNARLVISNGKIVLGCLIFLICYAFRRKQATLKRIARRRAFSMKKALVDLWQLAFSYQVNPLAAVQPLPAAARGSR